MTKANFAACPMLSLGLASGGDPLRTGILQPGQTGIGAGIVGGPAALSENVGHS
jgi:hypothetical protein